MHKQHAFHCSNYLSPPRTHTHKRNSISNVKVDNPRARGKRRGFTQRQRATRSQPESIYGEASARQPIFWEKNQVEPGVQGLGMAVAQRGFVGSKLVFGVFRGYQWGPWADSRIFFEKKFGSKKGKTLKNIRLFFFDMGLIFSQLTIIFFGETRDVCLRHGMFASFHCLLHFFLMPCCFPPPWICTHITCISLFRLPLPAKHTLILPRTNTTFYMPLFFCLFSHLPLWTCTFDMHHSLHLPLSRTHTHSQSHHFICSIYFDRIASNQEFFILYIHQSNKKIILYIHVDRIMIYRYVYIDR